MDDSAQSDQPKKDSSGKGLGGSRYPLEAFQAVSEGLSYTIRKVHGPETDAHRRLAKLMAKENLDWMELATLYDSGNLPEPIISDINEIGGAEKLNRHIGGRELCWGLREFALKRWGMLARTVLSRWNIKETSDFGRIVFETIKQGYMQKEPGDSDRDFRDIYDFSEAFDEVYRAISEDSHDSDDDDEPESDD